MLLAQIDLDLDYKMMNKTFVIVIFLLTLKMEKQYCGKSFLHPCSFLSQSLQMPYIQINCCC